MKRIISVIILSLFCGLSLLGQTSDKKPYPDITWTEKQECLIRDIPAEVLQKNKIACDQFVLNGERVRIIRFGEVVVSVSLGIDEGYIVADALVINNSSERVLVDPERSLLWVYKSANTQTPERLQPVAPSKIAEKINRRVMWANALATFGTAFQTKRTTVTSQSSGSVSVFDNRGNSANGTYTGTTTATVKTPDTDAQNLTAAENARRTAEAQRSGDKIISSAFVANTLFENGSANGLIYFKKQKADLAIFVINLADMNFRFTFSYKK